MNLAQIVQSHALSFFHLSSPDLLFGFDADPARRNIFGVAADHPQLARDGIALRRFGQQIIERLGGKRIHPAWVVAGGVSRPLAADERDDILASLPEARAAARRTLDWYKAHLGDWAEEATSFADFPSLYVGLVDDDGSVAYSDGALACRRRRRPRLADDVDPRPYDDYFGEAVEPWSYLKSAYWKPAGYPDGLYRVGPLARLNVIDRLGTEQADAELAEYRQRARPLPVELVPLPLRPADRDPPLHRRDRRPLESPDILDRERARPRRRQPPRGRRRRRGTAWHVDPPLPRRRRRADPLGQPPHRDWAQQPGDEPRGARGRPALRRRATTHRRHAQPRRGGDPLLRPVPQLLHTRPRPDGACGCN